MGRVGKDKNYNRKKLGKKLLVSLIIVVAAGIIIVALELTNTTHFFHNQKQAAVTTGGQYTKGIPSDKSNTSQSSSDTTDSSSGQSDSSDVQPGDTKHQEASSDDRNLLAPTGTFANVYTANADDQMGSTCNTSPGATCQLIFTMGSITKSLPIQTADRGGAVYWSWHPKDIGLTPGTWHITAKATLGSQTKETSNDPLTLKVN